jgi:RND family efflux transporter MFP subunit
MNMTPRAGLALSLLLTFSACGSDTPAAPKAETPMRVSVVSVGQVAEAPSIEAAGSAALRKEIPLGFTSPGRIARIYVQEGDRVRAGQVLAVLDTTTVAATVDTAVAERDRAGAELRRIKTLFEQGWVTRARLESAEAAARTAEANLRSRRFSLETARVLAPSSGIILARQAEPAQIVDAGTPIVTLGDSGSGFVLRALLSDRDAVRVRPGISAQITFEALPGPPLAGKVIEVGGRSDRGSGAFTVEIALAADARLRSGLVGRARIAAPAAGGSTRLVIPPTAIFSARADEGFVYVVGTDNRLRVRRVSLGQLDAAGSEVLSGLALGDTIVVSGLERLREGLRIEPVRAAP